MAFLFVLAILVDSACAAACIPMELKAQPAQDCSRSHHDGDRESCDLHGHLTPVVKERTGTAVADAPASLDGPTEFVPRAASRIALAYGDVQEAPPPLARNSILRI